MREWLWWSLAIHWYETITQWQEPTFLVLMHLTWSYFLKCSLIVSSIGGIASLPDSSTRLLAGLKACLRIKTEVKKPLCTLALKVIQLSWALLLPSVALRSNYHEILSSRPLKKSRFALKLRLSLIICLAVFSQDFKLLFFMVAVTKTTPVLHVLDNFLIFYLWSQCSRTSPLDCSSVIWIKKLSSTHCRSV